MSLREKINRFYDELWRFAEQQFAGKASVAAAALGISKNRLAEANLGEHRGPCRPNPSTLVKCIANGDAGLVRAAKELLVAYHPTAGPVVIVQDLPPSVEQWLARESSVKVIRYEELVRLAPPAEQAISSQRNLPNLIKLYTHAALQMEAGAFGNGALAQGVHQDSDVGALEAYAIVDLVQGFVDLMYFQSLAAALRTDQGKTAYHSVPLHPFGAIEPSTIMREPPLPSESEEIKALRRLTKLDGRSTAFMFYEHNEKRPRYTPTEIVSLIAPRLTQPLELFNLLRPALKSAKHEFPEPALVCAGASVAAVRLALSLISSTNSLFRLGQMSPCLEAVASKVGELCRHSYEELAARMREALDGLQDDAERTALEREIALTVAALFREQGVWFIFNDQLAFLSKCGSLIQSLAMAGKAEHHRFLDAQHSCELPKARVYGHDPIWFFRGAACTPAALEGPSPTSGS